MRFLFVGGGSMGHIAPGIAVAQALRIREPTSEILFVCLPSQREVDYIRAHGFEAHTLAAPRMSFGFPVTFFRAVRSARRILATFQPDLIFSKGAYVSLPLCFAARRQKIPIVLHESDAVSGNANKIVSRWAAAICTGLPSIHRKDGSTRTRVRHFFTGNPIRQGIDRGSKQEGLRLTGFTGTKPILLVTGGSQGAQTINELIVAAIDELREICDVIHITGVGKRTVIRGDGYWQREFVTEELPHLYAVTDLAVARAGAGSIAELAANAIPSILIPLRGLANDHQQHNAEAAAASGGCIALQQDEGPHALADQICLLIADTQKRDTMRIAIRTLSIPDAAGQIVQTMLETLAGPQVPA